MDLEVLKHLSTTMALSSTGRGEEDVGDTAQHRVNPAAEEAGDGTDQGTDDHTSSVESTDRQ